jgi:arylsulfatase A-like enzyme
MVLLLAGLASGCFAKESAPRPNIVVVMTDDSGYTDLGCYGGEIDTPNLDALAKSGVRFKNFYNNGRCSPTRASLMTGHDAARL